MTMQQPGPESALPVSEYLETEPPKWPLVMGIVALLWGGMVSVSGVQLGLVAVAFCVFHTPPFVAPT